MKITSYGHSCFALCFANGTTIITDPFDDTTGYPLCEASCDAASLSHDHFDHNHTQSLKGDFVTLNEAGQREVGGVKVTAIASFHDDKQGALRGPNLLTKFEADGLKIAHLGDLGHMPDDAQVEFLKGLDVLMIPIGGHFTIDTAQAEAIVRAVKPHTVIAMHFKAGRNDFPISTEEAFAADMGAVRMPREIEFKSAAELPAAIVMDWQ